jgi:hypothetical protein
MVCGINAPAMFFLLLKGSIKRVVSSISVYLALILADFLETRVHNTRPKTIPRVADIRCGRRRPCLG